MNHCGMEMTKTQGNLTMTVDGIEVTLVGAWYAQCAQCSHVELRSDVQTLLDELLAQKKALPDSPPHLYVNVPELLS